MRRKRASNFKPNGHNLLPAQKPSATKENVELQTCLEMEERCERR